MKKTMNFKYLAITGNLIGLMTATGKKTVSINGYTLSVNTLNIYTLTDSNNNVLDQWAGLPQSKFETM